MKLLLDTHTFLWWHGDRTRLSSPVLELCEQSENMVFLSMASVWEIQIKNQLDKLKLSRPLAAIIELERQENSIELLPISLSHILELYDLPSHHRDPFDRLLIAQARIENLILLTADPLVKQYPVQVLW